MRFLSEETQAGLEDYMPYLMREIGLHNWEIDVRPQTAEQGTHAQTEVDYPILYASIKLCSDWEELTAHQQRRALVHELLHVLHYPLTEHIDALLPSPEMKKVLDLDIEHYTERMAKLIAPRFDLPQGRHRDVIEDFMGTRFTTEGVDNRE